jgi:signal transduction histidine kinase
MRKPIARRLVGASAGVLSIFWFSTFTINVVLLSGVHDRWVQTGVSELGDARLAQCEADPAAFHTEVAFTHVWALDDAGNPIHPEAPKLSAPVDTAPGEMRVLDPDGFGPQWAAVFDTGRDGPCRRLVAHEKAWMGIGIWNFAARQFGWRVITAVILIGVVWRVVVSPITRRLRDLAEGTRGIVAAGFSGDLPRGGDDELDALAGAFNQAAAAARERLELLARRDRITREIVANLAHDVRTPLAALKIGVGRLLADHPDAAGGRTVLTELAYLDGLVGNLTAMVELEGTGLPLVPLPVDARDLVQRAAARFRLVASGRGVDVHSSVPDDPLMIRVDPIALEQALGNLVHNAIDFASGNVAILCFRDGDDAVLEVRDDGPGVDAIEIPRLSERTFRGEGSRTRGRPGQGLGLAIANEVMARHGGRMSLARQEEGGTVATLRLLSRAEPVTAPPSPPRGDPQS